MSLDYAILGFLESQPLSGYDLKTKCFDNDASHFWTADQAQVYRTLDRLQRKKLVRSKRQRQSVKPDRRVYTITDQGREALLDWLSREQPLPPHRDPFLIQLFFAEELEDETLARIMESRRDEHQSRLEELRASAAEITTGKKRREDRATTLRRMTLDAAMSAERAAIDWIDDCLEHLSEGATTGGSSQRQLFRVKE